MVKIEKVLKEDIEEILELAENIFKQHMSNNKGYINYVTNWDMSVKLTLDDKIIGFYLFNDNDIFDDLFKNKNGVQGIALGVDSNYRGLGYGKQLIEESYKLFQDDYDYIWGIHLTSLDNEEDWKKRRTIFHKTTGSFTSYRFLK
jgi:GNAT superfamily N-acetyltransferase